MRAVVQRVSSASVDVEGKRVSEIGPGLLVLLGVGHGDGEGEVEWLVEKIANLRIFEDADGKMNRSLLEGSKALIVVSQFTLFGDTRKGRRPSFIDAAPPEKAIPLYERFIEKSRALGLQTGTGIFGADMKVSLVNDGPVTLWVETPARASVG
jgi:D-tyrosyl-tRNA(Tyr) deacylase